MVERPDGISLERNRDLSGMLASPLYRRVLLACIAALPILALFGVFGQHPTTSTAHPVPPFEAPRSERIPRRY